MESSHTPLLQTFPLPDTLTEAGLRLYLREGEAPEKVSHDALLEALYLYTGHRYTAGDILRRPNEKPYLTDGSVQFSVTHSGGIWMACMSPVPVGLDLQIHKHKYSPGVAGRYFHPTELALLDAAKNDGTDTSLFFDLWCARESYAKYTGDGVAAMDKSYSTTASPIPLYKLTFQQGYSLYLCTLLPNHTNSSSC